MIDLRIIERLSSRFASPAIALMHYRSEPLPGFSGLTAQQLVDAGRGDEVLEFIDAVGAGIYA